MKMDAEKQKRVLENCVEYYKEQAVRLTNNMPKWNPAMQNDRPVKSKTNSKYCLPVIDGLDNN